MGGEVLKSGVGHIHLALGHWHAMMCVVLANVELKVIYLKIANMKLIQPL